MRYYVRASALAEPKGPFDVAEIVQHIQKTWLPETAEVAEPGSSSWTAIHQVPEFAVALGAVRASGQASAAQKPFVPHGRLSCPQCRNATSGGRSCWIVGLIIVTFPIGLLFLLVPSLYRCLSCGYTFKA